MAQDAVHLPQEPAWIDAVLEDLGAEDRVECLVLERDGAAVEVEIYMLPL
jgi:hypothetical protein